MKGPWRNSAPVAEIRQMYFAVPDPYTYSAQSKVMHELSAPAENAEEDDCNDLLD